MRLGNSCDGLDAYQVVYTTVPILVGSVLVTMVVVKISKTVSAFFQERDLLITTNATLTANLNNMKKERDEWKEKHVQLKKENDDLKKPGYFSRAVGFLKDLNTVFTFGRNVNSIST